MTLTPTYISNATPMYRDTSSNAIDWRRETLAVAYDIRQDVRTPATAFGMMVQDMLDDDDGDEISELFAGLSVKRIRDAMFETRKLKMSRLDRPSLTMSLRINLNGIIDHIIHYIIKGVRR